MTVSAAAVAEALSRDGKELPLVAARVERQLQHAVRVVVPDEAGFQGLSEGIVQTASRSDDEFTNPSLIVGLPIGRLRRKPLVVVFLSVQDQLGPSVVEKLPDRLHYLRAAVNRSRAEERVVPVRQRARVLVLRKVRAQPLPLWGPPLTAADLVTHRVDDDHVPGAEVVAVIRLPARAGGGAEIVEVPRAVGSLLSGPGPVVFVTANRRACPRLELPPGRAVAL